MGRRSLRVWTDRAPDRLSRGFKVPQTGHGVSPFTGLRSPARPGSSEGSPFHSIRDVLPGPSRSSRCEADGTMQGIWPDRSGGHSSPDGRYAFPSGTNSRNDEDDDIFRADAAGSMDAETNVMFTYGQ